MNLDSIGIKLENVDDDIKSIIDEYDALTEKIAALESRVAEIKEHLINQMQKKGCTKIEAVTQSGRLCHVIFVQGGERISYPKKDLDAIAKTNKQLQRILDKIKTVTTVKPYVRIVF